MWAWVVNDFVWANRSLSLFVTFSVPGSVTFGADAVDLEALVTSSARLLLVRYADGARCLLRGSHHGFFARRYLFLNLVVHAGLAIKPATVRIA